jgi:hypothetical protein
MSVTLRPDFPGLQRVINRADDATGVIVGKGLMPGEVKVRWDDTGEVTHIARDRLIERDNLPVLFLCSAILETARRLQSDLEALKKAADEFCADMEKFAERS